ncbi:MAG TPA: hypothetical protein VLB73_02090 [Patescibacteria group bacterium]|nr:hypothetical protein [Patescibacteria group bacterium]
MDQNDQQLQQSVNPLPVQPQVSQTAQKTSLFPKILLSFFTVIVVLGLIGGAYYLGAKNNAVTHKIQSVPSVTPVPTVITTTTPVASPSPILQTLVAGGIYTFAKYQIGYPAGWLSSRTNTAAGDIVTLTKVGYQLKISQGAFDGGACSYPDKPLDPASGIMQSFVSSVEIRDQNNTLYRRGKLEQSGLPGQDKYEVCAFSTKNNVFQEFTPFGRIDYITPVNADASILSEMDTIITSLKAQ